MNLAHSIDAFNTKLSQLLMHFKARNYPESLTQDEQEDWFEVVQSRMQAGENGYLSIDEYYYF
jgi:exodeoxyribonuclease-1